MDTPRPTLDVDNLKDILRKKHPKYFDCNARDKARIQYVLTKFRKLQQKLLEPDTDVKDPDPYVPTYIFYCFQGALEE